MPTAIMGRIFAADTALATLGECISAVYAGILLDYAHISPNQLAFVQAMITFLFFLAWGVYHAQGRGVPCEEKRLSIELRHILA